MRDIFANLVILIIPVYTCHASWTENHTTFIVARHVGTQHGVCISYKENDPKSAQLYVGDTCYRSTSKIEHLLVSSLTSYGEFIGFPFDNLNSQLFSFHFRWRYVFGNKCIYIYIADGNYKYFPYILFHHIMAGQ